jgi:hypothetical protein
LNTGTIAGANTGIFNAVGGTITGGVNNTGSISAISRGILIAGSSLADGITNSGTIAANGGIRLATNTNVTGGINNSGLINTGGDFSNIKNIILIFWWQSITKHLRTQGRQQ